jgi:hypothetical protein
MMNTKKVTTSFTLLLLLLLLLFSSHRVTSAGLERLPVLPAHHSKPNVLEAVRFVF